LQETGHQVFQAIIWDVAGERGSSVLQMNSKCCYQKFAAMVAANPVT
jgi:hypothetical protein